MNEEMELQEMELNNDIIEEEDYTYNECEDSDNNILGKVLVGGLIAAIGFGAYVGVRKLKKKGSKLDEWRIKKLEKKGFIVTSDCEEESIWDDQDEDSNVYTEE